jgi:Mannosyltransferase (PIG-V)
VRDQDRLGTWGASARAAWAAFWPSRLVLFGVAAWVTFAGLTPFIPPESPVLSHPFGDWPLSGVFDMLFSSLAKWDTQHYLAIAYDGYAESYSGLPPFENRPAFFPLYPGTVHVLSGFGADPALVLIAAFVVSLACFLGALVLLHRLTVIEIGERYGRPVLLLFAFFPTALFFGIPYTESMFLLLAIGAFLAARLGRWPQAGLVLALASATRVPGLLLIVPVAMLYLYGPRADRDPAPGRGLRPRYRIGPEAAWLLLAPLGLLAFSAYLHFTLDDALAWQHAQELFNRHTVDPLTGIWAGLREAGESLGRIPGETFRESSGDYLNVMELGFVVFAVVGAIGVLRTLPTAYGTWVLLSLVPIFVSQPSDNPLWSAPRFIAVLFPIFLWLAIACERRQATTVVVALFAAGLAVFTAQFVLWSFVA